jgi:hypothetical protein
MTCRQNVAARSVDERSPLVQRESEDRTRGSLGVAHVRLLGVTPKLETCGDIALAALPPRVARIDGCQAASSPTPAMRWRRARSAGCTLPRASGLPHSGQPGRHVARVLIARRGRSESAAQAEGRAPRHLIAVDVVHVMYPSRRDVAMSVAGQCRHQPHQRADVGMPAVVCLPAGRADTIGRPHTAVGDLQYAAVGGNRS